MMWESIRWPWASTTSWNCMNINSNRGTGIPACANFGRSLRPRQENRQPGLVLIAGPVSLRVVHCRDIDLTRSKLRVGDGRRGVAAAADGHHEAVLSALDATHGHTGERGRHHLVHEIGTAAAQVVREI